MTNGPPYALPGSSSALLLANQIIAVIFASCTLLLAIIRAVQIRNQRIRNKIIHAPTTVTSMLALILSAGTAWMALLNQYGNSVLPITNCSTFMTILGTCWGGSRIFLYWFLSYRTQLAFESTVYGFRASTLRAFRIIVALLFLPFIIVLWVELPGVTSFVVPGTCGLDISEYVLAYAGGLDFLCAVITIYMFASRMVEMHSQRHSEKRSMLIDPVFKAFQRHSVLGVISIVSVVIGMVCLGLVSGVDGIVMSLTFMIQALCVFNMFSENTALYKLLCACFEGKEIVTILAGNKLNFVFTFRANKNDQVITLRTYKPSVSATQSSSSGMSIDRDDRVTPLHTDFSPPPPNQKHEPFDLANDKFSLVFGNSYLRDDAETQMHDVLTGKEDITWVRTVPTNKPETSGRKMTLPKLERADTPTLIQFCHAMQTLGEHIVSESHRAKDTSPLLEEDDADNVFSQHMLPGKNGPPRTPPNVLALTGTPSGSRDGGPPPVPPKPPSPQFGRVASRSPTVGAVPSPVRAPSALAGMDLAADNPQNRLAAILRGNGRDNPFKAVLSVLPSNDPPPPPKVYMVPLILDL